MTVIEMQEYMRASRSKAYGLIWSGEIDSYRLGRKLLVSRASVDAHIDSRSSRAREGASRRKDLRHALVDGGTAPLNQVRADKGKLRVAIASLLRRSILVFRNLEEAANLFQGHHQQQFHPAPLLHSPPAHAKRLLVAH